MGPHRPGRRGSRPSTPRPVSSGSLTVRKIRSLAAAVLVMTALATTGCSHNAGRGAAIGAAAGAGLGALSGRGILGGAATGAVVGGAGGYIYDRARHW